ncbi:MAG: toprim domain-containing protein [Chloroflexi bacterium]|nr:toprim domain-containing protein [Chloroflexota bacterium]
MATVFHRRHDVEALKRAHPLAQVVAMSGVRLVRAGPSSLKGLCPFHDDRRPSLVVDERDEHFHCYGCRAHGDVISWVMRRDGLSFSAACDLLIGLPRSTRPAARVSAPQRSERVRRWDRLTLTEQVAMNMAGAVYHHTLWREPRALAYLRDRGIPDWVIRRCWLGYADGDSLSQFLRTRRGLEVAQELGLIQRTGRRGPDSALRDVLVGRIVVPELRGGQTIWMIGRSLDDGSDRPKYLALGGERPVLGFERAVGRKEAVLCEGVFDYLTAVGWGLPAFSPCGTHIPAERLGFLARAERVFGVFDGDAAGDEAAARFGVQLGDRWRPLRLPDGTDLNELGLRPHGRDWFYRLLSAARMGSARTEEHRGYAQ